MQARFEYLIEYWMIFADSFVVSSAEWHVVESADIAGLDVLLPWVGGGIDGFMSTSTTKSSYGSLKKELFCNWIIIFFLYCFIL